MLLLHHFPTGFSVRAHKKEAAFATSSFVDPYQTDQRE